MIRQKKIHQLMGMKRKEGGCGGLVEIVLKTFKDQVENP